MGLASRYTCFIKIMWDISFFFHALKPWKCYWNYFLTVLSPFLTIGILSEWSGVLPECSVPMWLGILMIILTAIIIKPYWERTLGRNIGKSLRISMEHFFGRKSLHSSEWHPTKRGIWNRSPAVLFFCLNNTNITV